MVLNTLVDSFLPQSESVGLKRLMDDYRCIIICYLSLATAVERENGILMLKNTDSVVGLLHSRHDTNRQVSMAMGSLSFTDKYRTELFVTAVQTPAVQGTLCLCKWQLHKRSEYSWPRSVTDNHRRQLTTGIWLPGRHFVWWFLNYVSNVINSLSYMITVLLQFLQTFDYVTICRCDVSSKVI